MGWGWWCFPREGFWGGSAEVALQMVSPHSQISSHVLSYLLLKPGTLVPMTVAIWWVIHLPLWNHLPADCLYRLDGAGSNLRRHQNRSNLHFSATHNHYLMNWCEKGFYVHSPQVQASTFTTSDQQTSTIVPSPSTQIGLLSDVGEV